MAGVWCDGRGVSVSVVLVGVGGVGGGWGGGFHQLGIVGADKEAEAVATHSNPFKPNLQVSRW